MSLPGCTWHYGFNYTGIVLQKLKNQELFLTMEINIRGVTSGVLGNRYKESSGKKKDYSK